MNAILLFASLLTVQALPTATVTGDVVTINADIAWIEPASGTAVVVPLETVQGTILIDPTMLASNDGIGPVAWRLSPGNYKVTAFSYPADRLNPQRTEVTLDVVIASPTRQQQIRTALQKLTLAKVDAAEALNELAALKPTKAELRAAALP